MHLKSVKLTQSCWWRCRRESLAADLSVSLAPHHPSRTVTEFESYKSKCGRDHSFGLKPVWEAATTYIDLGRCRWRMKRGMNLAPRNLRWRGVLVLTLWLLSIIVSMGSWRVSGAHGSGTTSTLVLQVIFFLQIKGQVLVQNVYWWSWTVATVWIWHGGVSRRGGFVDSGRS